MKKANRAAAPKDEVKPSTPAELRGSFSKNVDYGRLRRRSAAASVLAAAAPLAHSRLDSHILHSSSLDSATTMEVRSTTSDSSHEPPCWPNCEPTNEHGGGLKPEPRGRGCPRLDRSNSSCSGSPAPSPSKHFKFCFADPKSEDGCHRRAKHRRRHPHQRLRRHAQPRHPDCVRFNASGPVPQQGLISFQYISKLFQPWLWGPTKGPSQRSPDSSHDSSNYDADSGQFSVLVVVVLLLVVVGAAIYMSQNRDVWNTFGLEFASPSKVFGFENYMKNEVIDEMEEKTDSATFKSGGTKMEKVSQPESDASAVGLEKYLRKKANRIINKLN